MLDLVLGSLKKYLLIGAAGAALLYTSYLYGRHEMSGEYKAAALVQKVKDLNLGIAIQSADQQRLVQQQARIDQLKKDLADARTKISKPNSVCFDSSDVDQLRRVWTHPATTPPR